MDYQRLCVVSSLREQQVPTRRVRQAVTILDDLFPGWWELSLAAYRGRVAGNRSDVHVVVRNGFETVVDVPGGQMTFRSWLDSEAEQVEEGMVNSLCDLQKQGPLFRKASFGDSVTMDPEINVAQPTVMNTSLETYFVSELVREFDVDYVAENYRLDRRLIERAVEFEGAS